MSIKNWPGGVVRATPVTPSGPYQNSSASGVWTLDQQAYWEKQDLWPTAGNLDPSLFIENIFSTYLYTGNGSTQTITNGIDLSGKGGLVWTKTRNATGGLGFNYLFDTSRGVSNFLSSNNTNAASTIASYGVTAFNSTGFSVGDNATGDYSVNGPYNYASWTFRKQAKFFDVVTYTGNGSNPRLINHNLGSKPGFIMIKATSTTSNWFCAARKNDTTWVYALSLNTTAAGVDTTAALATSTQFDAAGIYDSTQNNTPNTNGVTYVAYLFAHDAGGFGAAGTDNVISCGSFTGNATITLGYEPQWVLLKQTDASGSWTLIDTMRGWTTDGDYEFLAANNSNAASSTTISLKPTATGMVSTLGSGTYIYIAIRRGPMRTPTSGTSVFGLNARTGTGANATVTGGQTDDAVLVKNRGSAVASLFSSRLTGTGYVVTSSTAAEVAAGTTILQANPWDVMDGVKVGTTSTITNASANTFINYLFRRAPGFFDVVCYTGTGSFSAFNHNLTVTPEFFITKDRANASVWYVYHKDIGVNNYLVLNTTAASAASSNWIAVTSTTFSISLTSTWVAYLFASVTGVSKVGSYTGTGTTKQIDCGFAAGARFVLIKRTDSTGDWYVWDSARGIVAGNDPYLLLNSTAAEVTNTDYVDTYSAGFEISSTAPAAINANGGTFIFLAIA